MVVCQELCRGHCPLEVYREDSPELYQAVAYPVPCRALCPVEVCREPCQGAACPALYPAEAYREDSPELCQGLFPAVCREHFRVEAYPERCRVLCPVGYQEHSLVGVCRAHYPEESQEA